MIYSLFANDVQWLPTAVREELVEWIRKQGVDPGRLAAMAFNLDKGETWFRVYKQDPWGRHVAFLDGDYEPEYEEFFIPLEGQPPRQLEYLIPSEQPPAWLGKPMPFILFDH